MSFLADFLRSLWRRAPAGSEPQAGPGAQPQARAPAAATNPRDAGPAIREAFAAFQSSDWARTAALCEPVLRAEPDNVDALQLAGVAAINEGRHETAVGLLSRAVQCRPASAEARNNLGTALARLGRNAEALQSYTKAVDLDAGYADAYNNRGVAMYALSRYQAALESFDRAIALQPGNAEAHFNRGTALQALKRNDEAAQSYRKAMSLRPGYVAAVFNLGVALKDAGDYAASLQVLEEGLAMDPDYDFLFGTWLYLKLRICDWDGIDAAFEELRARIKRGQKAANPLIVAMPVPAALQKEAISLWARAKHPASTSLGPLPKVPAGKRIHVAYCSADFYYHAIANQVAELLERHDRSRFELTGFSYGHGRNDRMRERIIASFDRFIDVSDLSDDEAAKMARDLGVDIAVDLGGFTDEARTGMFARRAAPAQVTYLGFPGTSGLDYFDYIVADEILIPEDDRQWYSEKVVYMPGSYQVNDTKRPVSEHAFTRSEAGLPETGFVYCCFNNNFKIQPPVFGVWMRVLERVEGSVLWLLSDNAQAEANLKKEAAKRGMDPARLVFAPRIAYAEHLARMKTADLFLDTLPYNGHGTAADALWAGLPVLTQPGDAFPGRVGASLVNAVGLAELVAASEKGYEEIAVALGKDPERMAALRKKLEDNRATAPLFDVGLFTRRIESAYEQMRDRYQAGLAPDHIYPGR